MEHLSVLPLRVTRCPPGYLQHELRDHCVDDELPRESERPHDVQLFRVLQVASGLAGGLPHTGRCGLSAIRPRPLPGHKPGNMARLVQPLPVPVSDCYRASVRHHGEAYSTSRDEGNPAAGCPYGGLVPQGQTLNHTLRQCR